MAKIITFSKVFPSYHPRKGEETNFIQKIWSSINVALPVSDHARSLESEVIKLMKEDWSPKHHTIRAGHRFKVGDTFSPRVWSEKPYSSKQIIIASDITITKDLPIKIERNGDEITIDICGKNKCNFNWNEYLQNVLPKYDSGIINRIAKNDGLTGVDLLDWFLNSPEFKRKRIFDGQIICWSPDIIY